MDNINRSFIACLLTLVACILRRDAKGATAALAEAFGGATIDAAPALPAPAAPVAEAPAQPATVTPAEVIEAGAANADDDTDAPARAALAALSYRDLQKRAMGYGLRANMKRDALVAAIAEAEARTTTTDDAATDATTTADDAEKPLTVREALGLIIPAYSKKGVKARKAGKDANVLYAVPCRDATGHIIKGKPSKATHATAKAHGGWITSGYARVRDGLVLPAAAVFRDADAAKRYLAAVEAQPAAKVEPATAKVEPATEPAAKAEPAATITLDKGKRLTKAQKAAALAAFAAGGGSVKLQGGNRVHVWASGRIAVAKDGVTPTADHIVGRVATADSAAA